MELDPDQMELWNSYTEENREKCFWLFLNTFVEKWEKQVMMTMNRTRIINKKMINKTMMKKKNIRLIMENKRRKTTQRMSFKIGQITWWIQEKETLNF